MKHLMTSAEACCWACTDISLLSLSSQLRKHLLDSLLYKSVCGEYKTQSSKWFGPFSRRFLSSFLLLFCFFLLVKDTMPWGNILFFPKTDSNFQTFQPAHNSNSKLTATSMPSLSLKALNKRANQYKIIKAYFIFVTDANSVRCNIFQIEHKKVHILSFVVIFGCFSKFLGIKN